MSRILKKLKLVFFRHGPQLELLFVYGGLCFSIFSYYNRSVWGIVLGYITLVMTGLLWGYCLRYVNRNVSNDFQLSIHCSTTHLVFGLSTAVLGWSIQQIMSKIHYDHWLSINYHFSIAVLLPIAIVISAEELFFRGYMLARMSAFTQNGVLQVCCTCVAWAFYKVLIHIWEGHSINSYLSLLLTEIYLTLPYTIWVYYTKNLCAPFISHFAWDYLMYGTRSSMPDWFL